MYLILVGQLDLWVCPKQSQFMCFLVKLLSVPCFILQSVLVLTVNYMVTLSISRGVCLCVCVCVCVCVFFYALPGWFYKLALLSLVRVHPESHRNIVCIVVKQYILVFIFFFPFLVVLWFKLRASYLVGRCSTWSHTSSPLFRIIFIQNKKKMSSVFPTHIP
jgi:hypothetical protein